MAARIDSSHFPNCDKMKMTSLSLILWTKQILVDDVKTYRLLVELLNSG